MLDVTTKTACIKIANSIPTISCSYIITSIFVMDSELLYICTDLKVITTVGIWVAIFATNASAITNR